MDIATGITATEFETTRLALLDRVVAMQGSVTAPPGYDVTGPVFEGEIHD